MMKKKILMCSLFSFVLGSYFTYSGLRYLFLKKVSNYKNGTI